MPKLFMFVLFFLAALLTLAATPLLILAMMFEGDADPVKHYFDLLFGLMDQK